MAKAYADCDEETLAIFDGVAFDDRLAAAAAAVATAVACCAACCAATACACASAAIAACC